ncbi:MAG TPA: sigma-54 dependent transcriptional regulator [Myxococcota bacterium]|nr:sigma-54 dependent transcriptional regulator [Myxococcota bacterium]
MTAGTRSVLVVDDDAAMRDMVVSLLEDQGIRAQAAGSVDEALKSLGESDVDAVLSDIRMPGRDGIELLGAMRELRPDTPVVLMTAFGSIDSAVEAMQAGAFDYVTKPFKRDALLVTLERAFERRALEEENRRLRRAVDQTASFGDLIGTSIAMREIFALIRKVADGRSSVLITGESGTGKELVARTLHFSGSRASRPFVPINCTAIPEGLLESELFGHVRGAFTGAHADKKGLFEVAHRGTVFLDEVGETHPGMQVRLLRVLQDGEIRPLGSSETRKVDVRILAATNRDLRKEVEAGRFREDLYYRLRVVEIDMPPLRERREDIPVLAHAFLDRSSRRMGRELKGFTNAAMDRLTGYPWPGNVRELENEIERIAALAGRADAVGVEMLSEHIRGAPPAPLPVGDGALPFGADLNTAVDALKRRMLQDAIRETGSKTRAAEKLGIPRQSLQKMMTRLGIQDAGDA